MKLKNKDKEKLKEKNYVKITQEKLKSQNAITLVSLVVTIVILIILATVSINVLLGEGGLINQAKTAKFETEKATAREQIEVVLLEAAMDKALNNEYNENEYLDKFVEDRLKGVWLEQDEIAYNGFIFALDRSVPKLGNYTGQDEGPRIKEIKVTGKTTNSVSIEVDARNAGGGKYTYSYKKDSDGEDAWIEVAKEVEENKCTFDNLEENEIYNLKVRIETSEGEIEQTINEMTGEVPKGTITFDEVEWIGDGTAKVRVNTSAQGYTMQYIIVKQGESTEGLPQKNWSEIASGSDITGLYLGDTVYARLYDGKNESDYASVTVEDKTAPEVTVSLNGATTSNSISVIVQAQDNESGIKETPTYMYYIKKTNEGEGSYQAPVGATSITSNTYTFTELTQGTSYDIKVEVNGDKAGNVGIGLLANQTTGSVPGAEGGLQTGNITASAPTWSNGTASITLSTSTGLTIQYQVNNTTEGSWQTGTNVTGLHHGDAVFARLTDGNNYGDEASVNILDGNAPTVSVTLGAVTENSIEVNVSASDAESGLASTNTYKYYANNILKHTGTETSYTITGLTAGTNYTIKVEAYDEAGNVGTDTKQTTTQVAGIPESTSYVGYYADVDGNGSVDGVIYADLAIGGSGKWDPSGDSSSATFGAYTIPRESNFKKYEISQKNYSNDFGTADVIKVTNANGNKRFYVMALDNVDSVVHCWYASAATEINDYATVTSPSFGSGEQNTRNMIAKWNAGAYGEKNSGDYTDMWGLSTVQIKINAEPAWYVPSKEEWSAFGGELKIQIQDYYKFGLDGDYWSSTLTSNYTAWNWMGFDTIFIYNNIQMYKNIRLGTAF